MGSSDLWRSLVHSLIGDPEWTSAEVAARAGVDLAQARQLWRALGFPPAPEDQPIFTRSDLAMLQAVQHLLQERGAQPQVILQLTRVTGQSLARVAAAQVAANAERFEQAGESAAGLAQMVAEIEATVPVLEPFLSYVWRRQLLAAMLRFGAASEEAPPGGRAQAVGFADLVGFTAISQQLSERELAEMVDRFEALAYEHIPERHGRVVKMIGDEVMFAADEPAVAADIALALVDAYAGDKALPEVRVGMAIGPVLSWEGDLFGPTVNLASRLVNIARPGTVLVSEDLGEQLRACPTYALRHLRPLRLKGIGRVRFWVLRPAAGGRD
jgi:adenylate cyclase